MAEPSVLPQGQVPPENNYQPGDPLNNRARNIIINNNNNNNGNQQQQQQPVRNHNTN